MAAALIAAGATLLNPWGRTHVSARADILVSPADTQVGRYGTAFRPGNNERVDAVFSRFDKSDSPGCAVAVVQNHHIAYSRGYGRASLELGVPITPKTVFDIGSTSKQFTAFSLLLLERDGKLSLDDDIRKYLPEIPDYGNRLTIRHLLTHTSGLRDYGDLMEFDGHEVADHTTERDALDTLARQHGVNFKPGEAFRYSNTGFFLASIIVKRAAGQSLVDFARARIFEPLGMSSSEYLDDTTRVVPGRATAYSPKAGGGFVVNMSRWDQIGDGSVQTTVEDLARWDENFYTPKVGDSRMLQAMQTAGQLTNGEPYAYGLGLAVDVYGGLRRVSHGGSWAGYRAELMRFPDQRTSIIALCNVSDSRPTALAESVAAAWLADAGLVRPAAAAPPAPRPAAPAVSEAGLREYEGRYASPDLIHPLTVRLVDHVLRLRAWKGAGEALTPAAPDQFTTGGTRIDFERDPASHVVTALTITNRGVEKLRLAK